MLSIAGTLAQITTSAAASDAGAYVQNPAGILAVLLVVLAMVFWAAEHPTLGRMVGQLIERAFGGATEQLVAHALEETDPSPEQLDEIRRLIDEYKARK